MMNDRNQSLEILLWEEVMKMEIKIAEETEVPVVYKLMLEAFEDYRTLDVPSSALNESLEALQIAVKSNFEKALLCSINGVPLGSCRFTMIEDALYFSRVPVTPSSRGKGIAKAMLLRLKNMLMTILKEKWNVVFECHYQKIFGCTNP
jgi:predicted N-acetyltransferase YhbS